MLSESEIFPVFQIKFEPQLPNTVRYCSWGEKYINFCPILHSILSSVAEQAELEFLRLLSEIIKKKKN